MQPRLCIIARRSAATLALVCAGLMMTQTALASSPSAGQRRSVDVSGHGEVRVAPDRAKLSMAVQATNPDLGTAEKKVDKIVRAYVAKARALGVKDTDLSTAGYTVQPKYDYSSKDGRKFVGYEVTRQIRLTVRDLGKIGDYLQQATAIGVNRVSAPVLESSQAAKLRLDALAKAAADARSRARVLAHTLGLKLGPAHSINVSASRVPGPIPMRMRAMVASAAPKAESGNQAMGFAAGEIVYDADVRVDFDLLSD